MKRFVLMAVAMVFMFALPAFAQDQAKPIAPKKQVKVKTDTEIQQQTPSGEESGAATIPVKKKGIKPKKQKNVKTDRELTAPSDQEDKDAVYREPAKKGLKPKKTKKVQTETEIERKGKSEKPDNP